MGEGVTTQTHFTLLSSWLMAPQNLGLQLPPLGMHQPLKWTRPITDALAVAHCNKAKCKPHQLQTFRTLMTFICRSLGIGLGSPFCPGLGFTRKDQQHPCLHGGGRTVGCLSLYSF